MSRKKKKETDKKRWTIAIAIVIPTISLIGLATGLPFLFLNKGYTDYTGYTVTWKNDDGTVLHVDEKVKPNTMPYYDGPTPAKMADKDLVYDFDAINGWDKPLQPVVEHTTYTVVYQQQNQNLRYRYDVQTDGFAVLGFIVGHEKDDEAIIGSTFKGLVNGQEVEKPVTGINESAFVNLPNSNKTLKRVLIPDTVGTIKRYAFSQCLVLEDIQWSVEYSQLTMIQGGAFLDTKGPWFEKEIILPKAVSELGSNVFRESTITKIVLPDTLSTIPDFAFYSCLQLESAILPKDLIDIEESAFSACSALASIDIPSKVEFIDNWVFSGCTGLTGIEFDPNGDLKVLGSGIFTGCSALKKVSLPNSVFIWQYSIFVNCIGLESVNIPTGVRNIPQSTFYYCKALKDIYIPDNIVEIENEAFGYTGLTEIYIPGSVETVGQNIFSGCTNLKSISSGVNAPDDGGNVPPDWNEEWLTGSGINTVSWDQPRP